MPLSIQVFLTYSRDAMKSILPSCKRGFQGGETRGRPFPCHLHSRYHPSTGRIHWIYSCGYMIRCKSCLIGSILPQNIVLWSIYLSKQFAAILPFHLFDFSAQMAIMTKPKTSDNMYINPFSCINQGTMHLSLHHLEYPKTPNANLEYTLP